jgi:repressor LexA
VPEPLSGKRKEILGFIAEYAQQHGYPPSVREIRDAVGLASPSTVHAHLRVLEREGYLDRFPTRPRAIAMRFDPASGVAGNPGPARVVPLVGHVGAGTGVLSDENVEELMVLPEELVGQGRLFVLRVRGDSMIGKGILDGDYVVVREQQRAEPGDVVVAGVGDDEATVKTFRPARNKVVLEPANPDVEPIELPRSEVRIYGKVVAVLRRL